MQQSDPSTPYDAAALAAAAVAGALAAAVNPGPYDVFSVIISATILLVIWAYERKRARSLSQSVALGAVVAFVSLLALGLPLELIAGGNLDGICNASKGQAPCRPNEMETAVPDRWLAIAWIVVTVAVAALDARFQVRLQKN